MAIIPTNSNYTNIANLPKAQLAVDSDLLILQTTNGTQTIPFNEFNVVRTDLYGNATVVGDLTGNNAIYTSINTISLTASDYRTVNGPGVTLIPDYYDKFVIQNGLILSATPTSIDYTNNPLYTSILATVTGLSAQEYNDIQGVYTSISAVSAAGLTNLQTVSSNLFSLMLPLTTAAVLNTVLSAGDNISFVEDDIKNLLSINAVGPGVARAWIAFNGKPPGGTTPLTIYSSYNVSGVSTSTPGYYVVSFTTPFADTNYCYALNCSTITSANCIAQFNENQTMSTGQLQFLISNSNTNLTPVTFANAPKYVYLIVYSL